MCFSAIELMHLLDHMYEAQNMELGDTDLVYTKQINVLELRAVLDDIIEQLPPLLVLGNVPATDSYDKYDFPYHRPSVVSTVSADSVTMPESTGFVLLQVSHSRMSYTQSTGQSQLNVLLWISCCKMSSWSVTTKRFTG